jgi:hypothetical protein
MGEGLERILLRDIIKPFHCTLAIDNTGEK